MDIPISDVKHRLRGSWLLGMAVLQSYPQPPHPIVVALSCLPCKSAVSCELPVLDYRSTACTGNGW